MSVRRLRSTLLRSFLVTALLVLTGGAAPPLGGADQQAVSINLAADYSAGTHAVIAVDPPGGPRAVQQNLNPTISDLGLNSFGRHFYVIERYMGDNITKYDIAAPGTPIWQYSVKDDDDPVGTVNPQNIVFVTEEKAYLLRHNSPLAWIINPNAPSQAEFKTGTLDLSAYNDGDGVGPEMTSGVVVGHKLFIVMQRFDQADNWEPGEAFVAVFDTVSDAEIHTGQHGVLKGIPLPLKNPMDIVYEPVTGLIYVQGQGRLAWDSLAPEYSGGIATINPHTYATSLLIDDGDELSHPYGNITGMTILSDQRGYFNAYAGWGDNTLYAFHPASGAVSGPVHAELAVIAITDVSVDQNGRLWVADATHSRIVIINPADNSIDEIINTDLNPEKVVFVSYSTFAPQAERVLHWLQWLLPELLPTARMISQDLDGWYIRHYPVTNIYLGAQADRLYGYLPDVGPEVLDLGSVSAWLETAAAAGF